MQDWGWTILTCERIGGPSKNFSLESYSCRPNKLASPVGIGVAQQATTPLHITAMNEHSSLAFSEI